MTRVWLIRSIEHDYDFIIFIIHIVYALLWDLGNETFEIG